MLLSECSRLLRAFSSSSDSTKKDALAELGSCGADVEVMVLDRERDLVGALVLEIRFALPPAVSGALTPGTMISPVSNAGFGAGDSESAEDPCLKGGMGDSGTRDGDRELEIADGVEIVFADGEYGAPAFRTDTIEEADVGRDRDFEPARERDFGGVMEPISAEESGGLRGKELKWWG